ncbi:MAG TPA: hypothetical protein VIR79_00200 [Nitrospira sp.]
MTLDLPQVVGPPVVEVWSHEHSPTFHQNQGVSAALVGELAVVTIELDESPQGGLHRASEEAYCRLLRELEEMGCPSLWRLWNFFPAINQQEGGLERYRQFCIGRHRALVDRLERFPGSLPAGTAVGTKSGPLQILAIAGRQAAVHLGNPRQVHAYDYPQHYGPCSPSFARASLLRVDHTAQLFIAGTSSVVGHESRHPDLPDAQARETVTNLEALLSHAQSSHPGSFEGQRASYRVYVRNVRQVNRIARELHEFFSAAQHVLYLQGDLCRSELLVEIEGFVQTP